MKNLLIASLLLFATAASATTATGNLSIQSAFVDRGIVLRDDATVGLNLEINDVIFDNVFATIDLVTTELTADTLNLRSDFGIGYKTNLAGFDFAASINRLDGAATYGATYNEARAELGYVLTERVRVFGRVAYPLTVVPDDLYATIGGSYLIGDNWRADVEVSGYQYAGTNASDLVFNDATAKVSYSINDSLGLFAGYSYGGERQNNVDLTSKVVVGASVYF